MKLFLLVALCGIGYALLLYLSDYLTARMARAKSEREEWRP